MNKLSDLLVIDREEAKVLYEAFNKWWTPQITTAKHEDLLVWDKLWKTLHDFIYEEEETD